MRIGIYNRWLSTLGGGERHSLAIAAHLAREHCVEYISHTPVTPSQVTSRSGLDLGQVDFQAIPLHRPEELGPIAAGYDLFINASNNDFVPPMAVRNAMLVFFPMRPQSRLSWRARRTIAGLVRQFGMQVRAVDGVYGLEDHAGAEAFGLADQALFVLPASPFRPLHVHFSLAPGQSGIKGVRIELDGEKLTSVDMRRTNRYIPVSLSVPPGGERIISIQAVGEVRRQGILLHMRPMRVQSLRASLYDYVFNRRWPDAGVRVQNLPPGAFTKIAGSYDLVWANSVYTQRWIHAYWGLPSTVLYPPVAVEQFAPGNKRPRILSVGRFFAGNHNKKHLEMIDAFRGLLEDGLVGWELHLAGGLTPGRQHLEYLEKVRQAAQGMPVYIHTDLPQRSLHDLYATGSIYWHAAGFDESPTRRPEKFEHFGIAVVEAMAAGCAPIVMGQGGVTELIRHGRDGFLWYTTGDLRTLTRRLARDAELRSSVAQAAIVSSRRFSEASFDSCLRDSLDSLLAQ